MTDPLPDRPDPSAYVLEARYDHIVVRAELTGTGWRMSVRRRGRLTRWADNGTETVYRMAEAVCDVMATELMATPADVAADLAALLPPGPHPAAPEESP